jgi:hypothetical protein
MKKKEKKEKEEEKEKKKREREREREREILPARKVEVFAVQRSGKKAPRSMHGAKGLSLILLGWSSSSRRKDSLTNSKR